MTDRPILFSAPMVRALLDGRKTMTRRLAWRREDGISSASGEPDCWFHPTIWQKARPGDRLWVRETHWRLGRWVKDGLTKTGRQRWRFRPDGESVLFDDPLYDSDMVRGADQPARYWKRPSIFLPRKFSRLTLVVTETKMERVQEISEADAKAEGCGLYVAGHGWITSSELRVDPGYSVYLAPRNGFEDTWNSLHKPGNRWEDNPEVCAISFTVHKANIDRLEAAGQHA